METVSLNKTRVYNENPTSKYWRSIECEPQTVNLTTWSASVEHPLFILKGIVVDSHDPNEIGKANDVYVQTYSWWLDEAIKEGIYTINQ